MDAIERERRQDQVRRQIEATLEKAGGTLATAELLRTMEAEHRFTLEETRAGLSYLRAAGVLNWTADGETTLGASEPFRE